MGTHPIFESDFDCLTESEMDVNNLSELKSEVSRLYRALDESEGRS